MSTPKKKVTSSTANTPENEVVQESAKDAKEVKKQEYSSAVISGMNIEFRKWKVREKLDLDVVDADNSITPTEKQVRKREIFVYNCLKNRVVFDIEQYNYVLSLIREYSIHNPIEFPIECSSCHKQFVKSLRTPSIITYREANYAPIEVEGYTFDMGNVVDPMYDFDVLDCTTTAKRLIVDFAYHVKTVNGERMEISSIIDIIEDMDVDIYQKLFNEFNKQKFLCDFAQDIECPHCGSVDKYELDDLETFFPVSWRI